MYVDYFKLKNSKHCDIVNDCFTVKAKIFWKLIRKLTALSGLLIQQILDPDGPTQKNYRFSKSHGYKQIKCTSALTFHQ
jgi:hypothetical protein